MPKLAAFPKAYMHALCKDGTMSISEWIEIAGGLEIYGVEWYAGFLEMADEANWPRFRREVEERGMVIPMMCCSPDFTHPDVDFRENEIAWEGFRRLDQHRRWSGRDRTTGAQRDVFEAENRAILVSVASLGPVNKLESLTHFQPAATELCRFYKYAPSVR